MIPQRTRLDPSKLSPAVAAFKAGLEKKLIGQPSAIEQVVRLLQPSMAGYIRPNKPLGVIMCVGPRGTGKTRLTSLLAELLLGNPKAYIKINCADFKQDHQTDRLTGPPPGYKESEKAKSLSLLSQEKLDQYHTENVKASIVLLDEVEKAHSNLADWFLAAFEDGECKVFGETVDFRNTLFIMTSNLGAGHASKSLGYTARELSEINQTAHGAAKKAVNGHFTREFIDRIDETIFFNALSSDQLTTVLDLEVSEITTQLLTASGAKPHFTFKIEPSARKEFIARGFHVESGARELKRVLTRHVYSPLTSMVDSKQIGHGDVVVVDFQHGDFLFEKYDSADVSHLDDAAWEDFKALAFA